MELVAFFGQCSRHSALMFQNTYSSMNMKMHKNDDKFALRAQVLMAGALSDGVTNQFNF